MPFRPAPLPTLLSFVGLMILLALGTWQVRRHFEATTRIAGIESKMTEAPAGPGAFADPDADLTWRVADLPGRYVGPVMLMTGRFEFGVTGYDVVQAFEVDGGPTLLVDRGWIPRDGYQDTLKQLEPLAGPATAHGVLLGLDAFRGGQRGGCTGASGKVPADATNPERWAPYAWDAMAAEVKGAPTRVLIAGDPLPEGKEKSNSHYPATGYRPKPNHLPHREYAATWFLIAGTLVVLWVLAGFRRGRSLLPDRKV